MEELVAVKTFWYRHQAELAKGFLSQQGIESVVSADDLPQQRPHIIFGTQAVQLLVSPGDLERARQAFKDSDIFQEQDAGMDVDYQSPEAALLYAASENSLEMVRFVIDRVSDITARDSHGKTALDYARTHGNQEMIDILQKYGA